LANGEKSLAYMGVKVRKSLNPKQMKVQPVCAFKKQYKFDPLNQYLPLS